MVIGKLINLKGYGRKQSWPNSRHYPGICVEGLRKATKNLSQNSPSPGQNINPEPPEHEAGVLTTESRRSQEWRKAIFILNIAARWKRAVSFKLRTFLSRKVSPVCDVRRAPELA
jgi:hypothetical protein